MGANRTNTEQFQLRLPPGLRDRIKAYAELQGRSTNAEIVRILEREFPEPESIEGRVGYLLELASVLAAGAEEAHVERLVGGLMDTVRRLADGTIQGLDEEARMRIGGRLSRWEEEYAEDAGAEETLGFDEVEIEAQSQGRSTAKYPLDREWRRYVRSLEGRDISEEAEDAYSRGFERGYRYGKGQTRTDDFDDEPSK